MADVPEHTHGFIWLVLFLLVFSCSKTEHILEKHEQQIKAIQVKVPNG